jgi:hypothetical protein
MKKSKPLTDQEGEVRELLLEDMRRFQPAAEALSPSLSAKLDTETEPAQQPASRTGRAPSVIRNQGQARKVAAVHYPFRCCVVCGLQLPASLTIAHLDHNAGNNDPDNIAYLCGTHHWMYDAGLYPKDAIRLLRAHWQTTAGNPDDKPRMKDAGIKAARARKRSSAARKAWQTRRLSR